jgi:uncharacterized protein Yka (UPF0111/DUF47 family)
VALRLVPRDPGFDDLFNQCAALLVEGSRELTATLAHDADERASAVARLAGLEQSLDEACHEVVRRAAATFITPFDRTDIHSLAGSLDDCMDLMASAAELIDLLGPSEIPKEIGQQVALLGRMAELVVQAMPWLADLRALAEVVVEINRLENAGDRLHRQLLGQLLVDDAADVPRMLRLKVITDELERAVDAFEELARTIESIALKES